MLLIINPVESDILTRIGIETSSFVITENVQTASKMPEAIMTIGDVIKKGNRKARRRAMRKIKK
jgi:hypothetical protein